MGSLLKEKANAVGIVDTTRHPDLVKLVHQIKEKHPSASLRFISQIAFKQGLKNKRVTPSIRTKSNEYFQLHRRRYVT